MRGLHGLWRGGEKRDHAAVADRRRLAVERDVHIEPGQRRGGRHPAQCRRPAIGLDDTAFQAQRGENGIIELPGPLKILRAHGDMTEHLALRCLHPHGEAVIESVGVRETP
ncbi:hypothetical protein D3C71_1623140 [compost metagenome]